MSEMLRTIQVLSSTIEIPSIHFDALYETLEEAAVDGLAPLPYEPTQNLLDHFRCVWGWTTTTQNGVLCHFAPSRESVTISYMERMFRLLAPYVKAPSATSCTFSYRDKVTEESFRYILLPGETGKPQRAQVIAEVGRVVWLNRDGRRKRHELDEVVAEIELSFGRESVLRSSQPGRVLAACLERASRYELNFWEANHRANNEEADMVDTQYMEDELVIPLRMAATLRALALELLIDHQVWPEFLPISMP